ncbi:MAG: hypothetical protein JW763_10820 [candidate division Zixibacteria bacterium]|nr:hypothetical protein [candidate division Zixibacteria bacterium]
MFVTIDRRFCGECSGSVFYGPNENEVIADLEKARDYLQSLKTVTPSALEDLRDMDINNVSRAGITSAVLHRLSADHREYPWHVVHLDEPRVVQTSFTVSIDSIENMIAEITSLPYKIIKIKMGFDGDEKLPAILKNLSGYLFRVDANGGWNVEKAEHMIYELHRAGITLIEQPTDVSLIAEWPHLKGRVPVELCVDEGLNELNDYERMAEFVDGINIKMAKSGGIMTALAIARRAQKDHRKVMLGCMVESSVAIASSVYMSSLADYFDLDGPLLLERDVAEGIRYIDDKVYVDETIIGGPKLNEKVLPNDIAGDH